MPRQAPIYVAVLLLEVRTPWVTSLKEKRSVITPVTEELKPRFPVSGPRPDVLDRQHRGVRGMRALSSDREWQRGAADSMMSRVQQFVAAGGLELGRVQLDIKIWEFYD